MSDRSARPEDEQQTRSLLHDVRPPERCTPLTGTLIRTVVAGHRGRSVFFRVDTSPDSNEERRRCGVPRLSVRSRCHARTSPRATTGSRHRPPDRRAHEPLDQSPPRLGDRPREVATEAVSRRSFRLACGARETVSCRSIRHAHAGLVRRRLALLVGSAMTAPFGEAFADDRAVASSPGPTRGPIGSNGPTSAALTALGTGMSMIAFIGHSKEPCHPGCRPPDGMAAIDRAVSSSGASCSRR